MRRNAPRLLGAGLLAAIVAAVALSGSARSANPQELKLTAQSEVRVYSTGLETSTKPGQKPRETRGYWGSLAGTDEGFYRATCTFLGVPRDKEGTDLLDCALLLDLKAGTVVGHGLVKVPPDDRLFAHDVKTDRRMAITGGTGRYAGATGFLVVGIPRMLVVQVTG